MTRIGIAHALVVIGLLFCSTDCEKQKPPDVRATQAIEPSLLNVPTTQAVKPSLLILAIWRIPGYSVPREGDHGVVAAVWEDGTIVRVSSWSEDRVLKPYVCGKLSQDQLNNIKQFVESTTMPELALRKQRIVVDGPYMTVVYRPSPKIMINIAQSVSLPDDSPIPAISDYLMALQLTDQQPSDFSGKIPGEWRPYRQRSVSK